MLPIMLQLYTVRDDLHKDFEGTLEEVARIGYHYVELALAQSYGKTAAQWKASLEKAGLSAVSAHVSYGDLMADPENTIKYYSAVGCTYIVIPYLDVPDRSTGPNYEEVKKNIAKIGELAHTKGLTLLYHNHEFEFVDYHGKYALDDLFDSIPAELLQTEIDVCWTKMGGVDPAEYILKYTGRSPIVHLKDFGSSARDTVKAESELIEEAKKASAEDSFPFRILGQGILDIPGIIKAAEKAGTQWLVVELDLPAPGKIPMACARECLNYLRSYS